MSSDPEPSEDREPTLWQELGHRGPANRPGGPEVDREQLQVFVNSPSSLSDSKREEVGRLIATYAAWYSAFVQILRGDSARG